MKIRVFIPNLILKVLLISILSMLCIPTCFAQNYTQMGLPRDAKSRLGKGRIQHMLYSPDGNIFAVVTEIGIWLHDTETYQEIKLLPIPIKKKSSIEIREINRTTFSADGLTLISEIDGGILLLWDVTTGESRMIFMSKDVYFSPDKMTFTIEKENKTIQLYQETKSDSYDALVEDKEAVFSFEVSPDGKTFATTDKFRYIISIKDTRTRKLIKRLTGFSEFRNLFQNHISLSPNGQTLAILRQGYPIRLWDLATGELKKTFKGYKVSRRSNFNLNRVRIQSDTLPDSSAFSPDGNWLASGNSDGSLRLWNTKTGKLRRKLIGHKGFINDIEFSPDGKSLASGGDEGIVLVWNLKTYTQKAFLAERIGSITCVSFSRDGSLLAAGNKDGNIHLFEATTGNSTMTLTEHPEDIYQVLFSPKGDKLASSSWDGSVRLWDIHTGKTIMTLSTIKELLWRELLFTNNGRLIAIRGGYEHIHLWDVTNGQYEKILMGHTSFSGDISLSADKTTLASAGGDGSILVWDLSSILNKTD